MFGVLIGFAAVAFMAIPLFFAAIAMLGAVFSGIAVLLAAGIFAGKGILPGFVLGFIAYRAFRKARMAAKME